MDSMMPGGDKGSSDTPNPPQQPNVPTYQEQIDTYLANQPRFNQAQYEAQQQYSTPMARNQRDMYAELYPEQAALSEKMSGIASQDMEGELTDLERQKYQSDINANMGTNVGSQIGAGAMAREMFGAGQSKKQGGLNLGLALSGRIPTAQYNNFGAQNSMTPSQSMAAQGATTNQNLGIYDAQMRNYNAMLQGQEDPWAGMLGSFGGSMGGGLGKGMSGGLMSMFSPKKGTTTQGTATPYIGGTNNSGTYSNSFYNGSYGSGQGYNVNSFGNYNGTVAPSGQGYTPIAL